MDKNDVCSYHNEQRFLVYTYIDIWHWVCRLYVVDFWKDLRRVARGFEDAPGAAGTGGGGRGLRCDVTSYLGGHLGLSRRTCGAGGAFQYRPDAVLHIFQA